ncbi:ATPase WRNIP1, partial [Operophtera brumata]
SDDNAALYWTTRALHGGEDPLYIARRLVRAACEDIASDDNAALYWTTRALHGGEDPLYIARRLVRAACEDIASDDNAALYWTTRALQGGEDPLYIARRLVRTACLADQNAVVEALACLQGCQQIGMPECDVLLAQCAVRLARAPKSREVYCAMKRCQQLLARGPLPPVPLHLRNAPTKLMKQLEGIEDEDFFRNCEDDDGG